MYICQHNHNKLILYLISFSYTKKIYSNNRQISSHLILSKLDLLPKILSLCAINPDTRKKIPMFLSNKRSNHKSKKEENPWLSLVRVNAPTQFFLVMKILKMLSFIKIKSWWLHCWARGSNTTVEQVNS